MQRTTRLFASLCAGLTILALAACGSAAPAATAIPATNTVTAAGGGDTTPEATEEAAKPSNAGGPGLALTLTGDAKAGAQVYLNNCKKCHGDDGKGGVSNPGSTDGTIPELNPIDKTITNKDPKVFAQNVDLFIEHGSTPEGEKPENQMTAFGDQKKLTPQQIADVIAYVISLNASK